MAPFASAIETTTSTKEITQWFSGFANAIARSIVVAKQFEALTNETTDHRLPSTPEFVTGVKEATQCIGDSSLESFKTVDELIGFLDARAKANQNSTD